MSRNGATATSSVVAANVCFPEAAKLFSAADIGRVAVRLLLDERGRRRMVSFQVGSA